MKEHKHIERLMLFSYVAKTLSFSRAAENLGISRGHLSEQIKLLEKELGTSLLNRSTRHVNLTKQGEQVLACMNNIKDSLTSMERGLHHENTELKGELKITAPLLFSQRYLNDICKDFHQKYPDVTFTLNTSYQNHDLNKQDFDIAFRSTKTPPLDMVAKHLLSYTHNIVASPKYLEAQGRPLSISELTQHQCITGEHQSHWPFYQREVPVSGWITLNDNVSILQHVLNAQGIARLPSYFVEEYLKERKLIQLFENEKAPNHQIYIIHPPKIQQSARLKAFLNHVIQHINQ